MTPVFCNGIPCCTSEPISLRPRIYLNLYISWKLLKYPIPKEKRIALVRLYFELCVTPGMSLPIISNCLETFLWLVRKLNLYDLRLPWRPIYTIMQNELFLSRRQYILRYQIEPASHRLQSHLQILSFLVHYQTIWAL
jgi:hypothetical protein